MSYLKDTNIVAYNQINMELSELNINDLDYMRNDIIQVVYWQCDQNPLHIWATSVYERGTVEVDNGCPFCKNEKYYPNGPKLILSRKISSRIRDSIEHRFHCSECNHTWNIISKDAPTYHDSCIYCSIGLKIPSFKEKYKEFIGEWDSEGNLLTPDQVTEEYPFEIKWHCPKCNQTWEATALDRELNYKSCPYCSGSKPIPDKTSFGALYPDLLKEYISWKERNPYEIFPNSNFSAKWKCPQCHIPYITNFNDRIKGKSVCPNCSSAHPVSAKLYDSIICEYDHKNNNIEMSIDELLITYKVPLSWVCSKCNNSWKESLFNRIYQGKQCPYCSEIKVIPGKDSLKALYPLLCQEYSPQNEDDPDFLFPFSAKHIIWKCRTCGSTWNARIDDRVKGKDDCPYCNGRKVIPGKTSLKALYPLLCKEYSNKNQEDPDNLLPTSLNSILWDCPKCGLTWDSTIDSRVKEEVDCPYCSGRKAIPGKTSLKALYPHICKEYSIQNEDDPDCLLPTSQKNIIWDCQECGFSWNSLLESRVNGFADCPYCNGRKVIPGKTSFKALYPDLCKEYSIENEDDPDLLFPLSPKRVTWNCQTYGLTWEATIEERVKGEVDCPYCSGRKVISGINSFKALHSDLMSEWDMISNLLLLDPDRIFDTCNKIAWWECNDCGYKYPMSPAKKAMYKKRKQTSCLKCKGMRRQKSHII